MQVRKIMTKNPACCTPDSTLQEVAHMMEMYDCGCIPVVENHQTSKPVGTITDRDIAIRTFAAGTNPLEMKASDIMTTDIATVSPDTSVQDCLKTMEKRQIRRILVVDEKGRVTGIVAQADLAEYAAGQTSHFLREVSETDNEHDKGFAVNRSFANENKVRTQDSRSFSLTESNEEKRERRHEKHRKTHREKESFFTSTTFLALLGSIGVGAGLRYYFGPETKNKTREFSGGKVKTYNLDAANTDKLTPTLTTSPKTPAVSSVGTKTTDREKITGSVDSFGKITTTFNKTTDDDDLKPITEVGKTATNS